MENIAEIFLLSRYTFLLEIQAAADQLCSCIDWKWIQVEKVAISSLSRTAIRNWVKELAIDQFICMSSLMQKCNYFIQSDGG
mmetsp:Transcript_9548/g.14751  ORF Transcript_9548/g.14751 Transcript_9548/m.14751 type:complete len:82 (-) Transcript_9548:12-257(-)